MHSIPNLSLLKIYILLVYIIADYRSRIHSLPPPEALRSVLPYMSERMRKRRAFADKELEVTMLERERHLEAEKIKHSGAVLAAAVMDPSRSRQLLGHMAPRDFLQRIFPTVNPNVLELVFQGCGGNLERTIEQLASSAAITQIHSAHILYQQRLLQMQSSMVPSSPRSTGSPPSGQSPLRVGQSNSAFTPHVRSQGQGVPPTNPSQVFNPAQMGALCGSYQALVSSMANPGVGGQPRPHPQVSKTELLSQRSAFQNISPGSPPATSSPRSPRTPDKSPDTCLPGHVNNRSPIKFSVDSLIAK